jgi:hypothetical protein
MSIDRPPSPTPDSGATAPSPDASGRLPSDESRSSLVRLKRMLFGGPKDIEDRSLLHRLSLVAFLAWIGLGADALSSSAYGPEEAFKAIGHHRYLALGLALATAGTVFVISAAYSKLIENFPNGGGYGVAARMLGARTGVVSGCALLVDYVLTITISIAAMGDAIFSFLPPSWLAWKFSGEVAAIAMLLGLNLRGIRESILLLAPVFIIFIITHAILILGGLALHAPEIANSARAISDNYHSDLSTIGLGAMLLIFLNAYSMGGGTYTGIEAVSNALPLMREPRVQTAKRTMVYLAISLAVTAGGLILCYLLWRVAPTEGKTMNAVLAEEVGRSLPFGQVFVVVTLVAEAVLLLVAAQAGFIGGPRVIANMAVDSWFPRRFAALSERLTTENGLYLMTAASLAALFCTHGRVDTIVIMYSINVFLTFSLTMAGMVRYWLRRRGPPATQVRRLALFGFGLVLCLVILVVTVVEKFSEGGWITLTVTGALVALCFLIHAHYQAVNAKVAKLFGELAGLPHSGKPVAALDPAQPTAVVLVAGFGGLGIHTVLNVFRVFPGHFKNLVFVSVGVMDSGGFKGDDTVDALKERTEEALRKYVELAARLGVPATYRFEVGTDAIDEAERACIQICKEFPRATFFGGKVIFKRERWYQWLLHNDTAHAVQKRLHWAGKTMVILPARIR